MTPNQRQRLRPLLKKLVMEVRQELKESEYPGIDRKIAGLQKELEELQTLINSGNIPKDPAQINLNLHKMKDLLYDCFQ